jgi:hypothetical protein
VAVCSGERSRLPWALGEGEKGEGGTVEQGEYEGGNGGCWGRWEPMVRSPLQSFSGEIGLELRIAAMVCENTKKK